MAKRPEEQFEGHNTPEVEQSTALFSSRGRSDFSLLSKINSAGIKTQVANARKKA